MNSLAVETSTIGDVQPWELHSELVLVSPEVCKRALELLPERDPDAFLAKSREPLPTASVSRNEGELSGGLTAAVARYGLWRIGQTVRPALLAVGLVAALACLGELLH